MGKNITSVFLLVFVWTCFNVFGQDEKKAHGLVSNFEQSFDFQPEKKYSREDGLKYNEAEYTNHPDFGRLPVDAPYGKRVVEDLSKRTVDERYYIDLDDPTFFYVQKAATPINFEKDGYLVAIHPYLSPSQNGVYKAERQPYPAELNTLNKNAVIYIDGQEFSFSNYSLVATLPDGTQETFSANWEAIQVGNEGALIENIFPKIDLRILFSKGQIKTEFILTEQPVYTELEFTDEIGFNDDFELIEGTENHRGKLLVRSSDQTPFLKIGAVKSFDASQAKELASIHPYISDENHLKFICDANFLHNPELTYPLLIDPLFTAVGPVNSAVGVIGSLESPASCSSTLNVNFPGGSTPWDFSAAWSIYADECFYNWYYYGYWPCYTGEAQVSITSNCGGRSPATGIWNCSPGCSNPGTWNPTLPFAASGTQSLAQCYTPSCSNQTLSFSFNLDRNSGCPSFGGADQCNWSSSWCITLDQWQVTVQGRSLETLGNTSTGNGYTAVVSSNCLGNSTLDPTVQYGVPGYSYSWSTGATTPTITVSNASSGATYTADVTDACGTTRTATFDITCPLAVTLTKFDAVNLEREVLLEWETATEQDNDYFVVQRSTDGIHFENIGMVKGAGNSNTTRYYHFSDPEPYTHISYYRLEIVDFQGTRDYSSTESVVRNNTDGSIQLIPNPAKESVNVVYTASVQDEYTILINSSRGERMLEKVVEVKKGMQSTHFDVSGLASGIYIVQILTKHEVFSERLIIE